VLHTVVTASLEDVPKAHQIALDEGRWILNRVAHTRLGRQVHHLLGLVISEGRLNTTRFVLPTRTQNLLFPLALGVSQVGLMRGWDNINFALLGFV
jgi:hypothetical protein